MFMYVILNIIHTKIVLFVEEQYVICIGNVKRTKCGSQNTEICISAN